MKIKLVFLFVCLFVLSCKNTYNDIVEETISSEVLSIDSLIVGNALGMIYVDSFLLIADNRNDSLFYWVSLIEQSASQVGRVGNGPNDFLDFDNFGFVTIGGLLIIIGAVLGVVLNFVNAKNKKMLQLVALIVSIAGGIVLFIGFKKGRKSCR